MNGISRMFQAFLLAAVVAAALSSAPVAASASHDANHPPGADSGSEPVGQSATSHTITASAGWGGSISPSGPVQIRHGGSVTFTITPYSGYVISSVAVDGANMGPDVTYYTFSRVTSDHTITASFREYAEWGCDAGIGALGLLAAALATVIIKKGKNNSAVKKLTSERM